VSGQGDRDDRPEEPHDAVVVARPDSVLRWAEMADGATVRYITATVTLVITETAAGVQGRW
jgi:hypothetical protein